MKIIQRGVNQKSFTKVSTQIKKNAIYERKYEEPSVKDNPVINETSYFNQLEYVRNPLNRLDVTCERV